jgi:hypothetical protein
MISPANANPFGPSRRTYRRRELPPRLLGQIELDSLEIGHLRSAIRANRVSFPSQVCTFAKHDRADLHWRVVLLYFVLGWSCESIACRYGFTEQRLRQILKAWVRRAVQNGYIQRIPPASAILSPA